MKAAVIQKVSKSFQVNRALRQGDPLSPILLNLVLEKVLRESNTHKGTLYHHTHQRVTYADCLAVLRRKPGEPKSFQKDRE